MEHRLTVWLIASFLVSVSGFAVAAGLAQPDCGALAEWSETIDPNDKWIPFPENQRVWLPKAMQDAEFESLFAKPALDWAQEDLVSARGSWNSCIQAAKKTRDKAQRDALQAARRYLTGNLRKVLRYKDRRSDTDTPADAASAPVHRPRDMMREQQRRAQAVPDAATPVQQSGTTTSGPTSAPGLTAGVDQLLAAPPSIEGLIALGSLSNLDVDDAAAIDKLEKQLGYTYGPAGKAGYRVVRELRYRGSAGFRENELPRINARLVEVKPGILEELLVEFSRNPTGIHEKKALAQRYEKLMSQLEGALTEGEYRTLADESRKKRREVVDDAIDQAVAAIDKVPATLEGLAKIDRIVADTAKRGLDIAQRRTLTSHSQARQKVVADQILGNATRQELPGLPDTLDGMKQLAGISKRMLRGVVQKADRAVIQEFVEASEQRLAQIGRKALPQYERMLAKVPQSEVGLKEVERELAEKRGWVDMPEAVRRDYIAAAQSRRDEIAAVVDQVRAQRRAAWERENRQAIAAGGDPRFVGSTWVDTNKTMRLEFRDEKKVFVTTLGIKFAGTYEVSRDDVIVTGPNGQLLYTLVDGKLSGFGSTFVRQSD